MKRIVCSSSNYQVLKTSAHGWFTLRQREGVGYADTPYTELVVDSRGLAEDYVVRIDLNSNVPRMDGEPVRYKYYSSNINYGHRLTQSSDADIKQFIAVLEEALEFEHDIKDIILNF